MKKNLLFYIFAISLLVLSFLSFRTAYKDMRAYLDLNRRSVIVLNAFQSLSRHLTNAAGFSPELRYQHLADGASGSFSSDSAAVIEQLRLLKLSAIDSVNLRLIQSLESLVQSELNWYATLGSSDPDQYRHSSAHLTRLKKVNLLVGDGVRRTDFLVKYRTLKLQDSVNRVKIWILILLSLAFALITTASLSAYRQYVKRRQKEQELYEQENRFRAMVEKSQDLIVIVDKNRKVLYRSPSAEQITGFSTEERIKNTNLDGVHPEDRQQVTDYLTDLKENSGKTIQCTYRLKHKQGHYIWLEGTFTSLVDDPNIGGIIINVKDVTAQKIAEEELVKSEKRSRHTLESMMEGVQIIDFDWRYIYVNDAVTDYSTYHRDKMLGKTVMELYPGVEQSDLFGVLKKCMYERLPQRLESEFVFPNGVKKHFELSVQPIEEGIFILSVDVTGKKTAQDNLEKNLKQLSDFRYALDEASIVAITDQKGIIQHVNDNFCRISHYKREELLGKDHRIVNSGYHSKDFIANLWKTIKKGQVWRGELKNKTSDGQIYWVDTTIIPFLDANKKPYQYLAIRNDITERKLAEEEIIKLNRLYTVISAVNQSIVHISDQDTLVKTVCELAIKKGGFVLASIDLLEGPNTLKNAAVSGEAEHVKNLRALAEIDYKADTASHTTISRALKTESYAVNNHLQTDPQLSGQLARLQQSNAHSEIALPLKKFGKLVGVFSLVSNQPGFFDSREIDLLLEAAGDISFAFEIFEKNRQFHAKEEEVIHNEMRFRAMLEKGSDLKTLTSADGRFVYASPSVSKVFGYTPEEFLNKPAYDFFHPEDVEDLLRQRTAIIGTPGAFFNFVYRAKHKDGRWIWVEGTLTNMLHEPALNAMVSDFRDISAMKLAQEQKEFDKKNLDALINNTNDLLWSIDKEFRLITGNQPFYDTVNRASGKELKKGDSIFSAALSETQAAHFKQLYERAFLGEPYVINDVYDSNANYAAEISFYPIRNGGVIVGTACHSRDISHRIKQEKERENMIADLLRYNKNLEQFAFIVSHNLRSPVANILGLTNLLDMDLPEQDKTRSREHLLKAVTQLDTVVKDLNSILELQSSTHLHAEPIDLREILQGIKDSISETIEREQVTIVADLTVYKFRSVKSYLYSILFNLIINGIKYKQRMSPPIIRISTHINDGKLLLVVSDNGLGMDLKNYGDKLFGLYQRFHLNVSGKGMGLFMVKSHVEALGGVISVKSTVGKGSEFSIELPLPNG